MPARDASKQCHARNFNQIHEYWGLQSLGYKGVFREEAMAHSHDHNEWSDMQLKVRSLESLLVEKGYVDPAALDVIIETYQLATSAITWINS